jgi:hypothetical protein
MFRPFVILAAVSVVFRAEAADITAVDSRDGKTRLTLSGEVAPGDNEAIKAQIKKANQTGRIVVTLRLDSIGGNLLEGVEIADTVRQAKMATAILSGAKCASACFVIFAAGNEKYAHYSASVGVHGASDASGQETTSANAATVSMAKIVRRLGVPTNIIGKMVVTPPSQMVWLTPDDLKSMGTSMLGKPEQLATESRQRPAQLPQDISPRTQATAPTNTWSALVDKAISLSSSQNDGKVNSGRVCQPELKTCVNAIWFKIGEKQMLLKVTRNLSDEIIKRELCELNSYRDIRTCLDWDTNETNKSMKNINGDWIGVSD